MRNTKKNWIAISIGAAGAGAGLMYLLDPKRGRSRREFVGDKALHATKVASRQFWGSGRDLSNRARGFAAETTSRLAGETVPDEVLAERVRSKIGRVLSHPKAVDVSAEGGVKAVRHDTLRTYADERGIPGFEQRGRQREPREEKRRPSRKLRALRMGIAIGSATVAAYRALMKSAQPRLQRIKPQSASDIAA
jgi:hypothetical protein